MADYFEAVVSAGADAKLAANWITGDIAPREQQSAQLCRTAVSTGQLAEMVQLIDGGKIGGKIAKEILPELLEKGGCRRSLTSVASA